MSFPQPTFSTQFALHKPPIRINTAHVCHPAKLAWHGRRAFEEAKRLLQTDDFLFFVHVVPPSDVPSAKKPNRRMYLVKQIGERYYERAPSFIENYFAPTSGPTARAPNQ